MDREILQLIEAFVAVDDPNARMLRDAASAYGFLPLCVGWARVLGVTPGGEVVEWDPEGGRPGITIVTNPYLKRFALAQGAHKYAQLAPLLPQRPPDAAACERCGGSGTLPLPRLICECGGLGWVVPGEDRSERW
jgi:hypothetical protein